ncbi:hypothetical protein COA20_07465 [Bacillus thuringiensis]|nr:hypothetical protein COA20_07465 [Bacillus thuringiensis]PGV70106.1 hypothetical protein COD84_27805 [Bacillus cereus]
MFCTKGTQDGKVLHALQEGYARWESVACFARRVRKMGECCMFCKKGTQGGKNVACFIVEVRMGKKTRILIKKHNFLERF